MKNTFCKKTFPEYDMSHPVDDSVDILTICRKYSKYLLLSIVFLIASIPLLRLGFAGDDLSNTLVKGTLLNLHQTFWGFIQQEIIGWIHRGRLAAISLILTYSYSYFCGTNLILYNFVHWLSMIISYLVAGIFLKKLNFSIKDILLCGCLLPFCWALFPETALVSYALILPALVTLMMLVFINYINFLQTQRLIYGFYSMIFMALALLTYEISFIVIPGILLLNKHYEGKFFIKNKAMYMIFLVTGLYLATALILRHLYVLSYPGIAFGDLHKFPSIFLKELLGELPLLFFLGDFKHFYALNFGIYGLALLLTICSMMANYLCLSKPIFKIHQLKYIFLISILLQIFPAAMVGISKKYQVDLGLGWRFAYLPVYVQQIGFTMMLVIAFSWIFSLPILSSPKSQVVIKTVLSLFISIITGMSFLANNSFANYWNQLDQYPREIYQQALYQGLFDDLPQNSIVLRPSFYFVEKNWNNRNFLKQFINRNDIAIGHLSASNLLAPSLKNIFYMDFKNLPYSGKSGYVFLGQIIDKNGASTFKVENVKIFFTARSPQDLNKVLQTIISDYHLEHDQEFIAEMNAVVSQHQALSRSISLPKNTIFYWQNNQLQVMQDPV